MKFDVSKLQWTREPENYRISPEKIEIITKPNTDLWQRTYYHFRNDNAPVLQMKTSDPFFLLLLKRNLPVNTGLTSAELLFIWTAKTGSKVLSNMKTTNSSTLEAL